MGRFNARTRHQYYSFNCLYCTRREGCRVMALHKQEHPTPEQAAEQDRLIPWDGKANGRCVEFEDIEKGDRQ